METPCYKTTGRPKGYLCQLKHESPSSMKIWESKSLSVLSKPTWCRQILAPLGESTKPQILATPPSDVVSTGGWSHAVCLVYELSDHMLSSKPLSQAWPQYDCSDGALRSGPKTFFNTSQITSCQDYKIWTLRFPLMRSLTISQRHGSKFSSTLNFQMCPP